MAFTPLDAPQTGQPPPAAGPVAGGRFKPLVEETAPAAPPAAAPAGPSLVEQGLHPLAGLASLLAPLIHPLQGAAEIGAAGATGALAQPVSGVAGLVASQLPPSLTGQNPVDLAAQTIQGVKERMTYPVGQAGRELMAPVVPALRKIGHAAGSLVPDNPAMQTIVPAVGEAVTSLAPFLKGPGAMAGAAERGIEAAAAPAAEGVVNPALTTARRLGIKVRPSDVTAATPGGALPAGAAGAERLTEPGKLARGLVLDNQRVITRSAGEDIGLKGAERLDEPQFDKVKAPEIKTYQEAEAAATRVPLSPELQSALDIAQTAARFKAGEKPGITRTLSALRRRSAKEIQAQDIATQDVGYANRDRADALEAAFAKQLESTGNAALFDKFTAARERLAKIHNVETATKGGQVDAAVLTRLAKKDVPLTGRLKMIADVQENFPHVTKHSSSTAAGGAKEIPTTIAGGIKEAGAAVIRNIPGLRSRLNVATEGFQQRAFGAKGGPTEASYFSEYGKPPEVTPQRGTLALEAPPGQVFEPAQQGLSLGDLMAPPRPSPFEVQPGPAFETAQRPLPFEPAPKPTPRKAKRQTHTGD